MGTSGGVRSVRPVDGGILPMFVEGADFVLLSILRANEVFAAFGKGKHHLTARFFVGRVVFVSFVDIFIIKFSDERLPAEHPFRFGFDHLGADATVRCFATYMPTVPTLEQSAVVVGWVERVVAPSFGGGKHAERHCAAATGGRLPER